MLFEHEKDVNFIRILFRNTTYNFSCKDGYSFYSFINYSLYNARSWKNLLLSFKKEKRRHPMNNQLIKNSCEE